MLALPGSDGAGGGGGFVSFFGETSGVPGPGVRTSEVIRMWCLDGELTERCVFFAFIASLLFFFVLVPREFGGGAAHLCLLLAGGSSASFHCLTGKAPTLKVGPKVHIAGPREENAVALSNATRH